MLCANLIYTDSDNHPLPANVSLLKSCPVWYLLHFSLDISIDRARLTSRMVTFAGKKTHDRRAPVFVRSFNAPPNPNPNPNPNPAPNTGLGPEQPPPPRLIAVRTPSNDACQYSHNTRSTAEDGTITLFSEIEKSLDRARDTGPQNMPNPNRWETSREGNLVITSP